MIYAVVSERNAPDFVIAQTVPIITALAFKGATMRTPYATIFDTEAYNAVSRVCREQVDRCDSFGLKPSPDLMKHASRYRENWSHLSEPVKKAHACLSATMVGHDAKSPVDFVIACWYEPGVVAHTVFKIATDYGIEVFNVADPEQVAKLWSKVTT